MVFRGPMFFLAHVAFGNTDSSPAESQGLLRGPGRILYGRRGNIHADMHAENADMHAENADMHADTSVGGGNRVLMEERGPQSPAEEEDLFWRAHRPCAKNPCLNGGTCTDFLDYGLDGPTVTCECADGFVGSKCQMRIDAKYHFHNYQHDPVTLPPILVGEGEEALKQILEVLRQIVENKKTIEIAGKNDKWVPSLATTGISPERRSEDLSQIGEDSTGIRLTERNKQAKHFSTLIAALLKHTLDVIFGATKILDRPTSSDESTEDGEEHNTPIDLNPYMTVMYEVDEFLGDVADISYHQGTIGEAVNDSFRAKHMPANLGKKIGKWIRAVGGLNVNIRELVAVNIEGITSLVQKIGERFDFTKPEAGKQIIKIAQQGDLVIVILEIIHPLVIEELQFFGLEDYEVVAKHVGELFITVVNDFLSLDYKSGVIAAIKSLFVEIRIQDKVIDGVALVYGDITEVWCWQEEHEKKLEEYMQMQENITSGPNSTTLAPRVSNLDDSPEAVNEGTSTIDEDRHLLTRGASVGEKSSSCNSKEKIRRWSERVKTMLSVIEYILKDVVPKFLDEEGLEDGRARPVGGLRYHPQIAP